VDGNIFRLRRLRYEKDGLYPEVWQVKNQKWVWSTTVIGLWVGGDCTIEEIKFEQAREYTTSGVLGSC
jgi:hypothetical protein